MDVGNNINPPAGSQRDYRATADSNVHPAKSGSGNTPTAEVVDPGPHGITQELDLALRPANENAPGAMPPIPSEEEGNAFNRSMGSQGVPSPESGRTAQVVPLKPSGDLGDLSREAGALLNEPRTPSAPKEPEIIRRHRPMYKRRST